MYEPIELWTSDNTAEAEVTHSAFLCVLCGKWFFNRSKEKTMATAAPPKTRLAGGGFLIQEQPLDDVFTVEDLTEEHLQIAQTTAEFAKNEILPNTEKIEHKDFDVIRGLLRKTCEIGIANVDIPEHYSGSDMDKISPSLLNEHIYLSPCFRVAFFRHVCHCPPPLVFFATPAPK